MSVWATVEDVQGMYESTVPARTQTIIDRVERRLGELVPNLTDRTELGPDEDTYLDPDAVKDVVVDAVVRQLLNPRGFTYERDGDYAVGYGKQGSGWFSGEELGRLRLATGSGPRTIGIAPPIAPPPCPLPAPVSEWTGDRLSGFLP